jgi:hypothetical protein
MLKRADLKGEVWWDLGERTDTNGSLESSSQHGADLSACSQEPQPGLASRGPTKGFRCEREVRAAHLPTTAVLSKPRAIDRIEVGPNGRIDAALARIGIGRVRHVTLAWRVGVCLDTRHQSRRQPYRSSLLGRELCVMGIPHSVRVVLERSDSRSKTVRLDTGARAFRG